MILEKVRNSGKVGYGFDAYKEEYCDMVAAGIIDPAKVTPESTLASLGLDSLDTVEVVMQCEDEFGIEIDQESNPSTVGEFVTVIDNTLGE